MYKHPRGHTRAHPVTPPSWPVYTGVYGISACACSGRIKVDAHLASRRLDSQESGHGVPLRLNVVVPPRSAVEEGGHGIVLAGFPVVVPDVQQVPNGVLLR